jgi:hypothetical protein
MSVLKPRTRVIYFRISEEEFGKLNELCQAQGARSLSDLARTAMQDMLGQANGHAEADPVATKLETLERMLAELNQALRSMGVTSLPPREASFTGGE